MIRQELAAAWGRHLRKLRVACGMSQHDLAIAAGALNRQEITQFEKGQNVPTLLTCWRLARAMGLPAVQLLPPEFFPLPTALDLADDRVVDETCTVPQACEAHPRPLAPTGALAEQLGCQ